MKASVIAVLAAVVVAGTLGARALLHDRVPDTVSGMPTIVDGDSLVIKGQRVRLYGIDAPEIGQTCYRADGTAWACGSVARIALVRIIGDSPVTCTRIDIDTYRRIIATCSTDANIDVAAELVMAGLAVAYRRYTDRYVPMEESARYHQRGIWAGRFDYPETWRRTHSR